MSEYILVTINAAPLRSDLSSFENAGEKIELVAGQLSFLCWRWLDPTPDLLAKAQAMEGHIGTVQVR